MVLLRGMGVAGVQPVERVAQVRQGHPVLGPARTRDRGLDRGQVQLEGLVEVRTGTGPAPQALLLGVRLHQVDQLGVPTGEAEVGQGLVVHGEERRRGPVLGRHVGDGRSISERQRGQAIARELHVRAHHAVLAQHLADDQHEVGRRGAPRQLAREAHAHHVGERLVQRLAQQHGLGLDAADAIAQDTQTGDHGRVGVGAHEGVRERLTSPATSRTWTTGARYSRLTW